MIVLVAVLAVFGLAAVTPVLVRLLGRNAGYLNAAVLAGLTAVLAANSPQVLGGEPVAVSLSWLPQVDVALALRMDALGLLFAVIVLGIGAVVMAYSARYFPADDPRKASRFLALLTLFAGSMLGLVLADDAIVLFVFWELTSISSFFLIGGKGEGGPGATRALLTTAIGGLALLAGAILLGVVGGTTSLSALADDPSAVIASPLAPAIIVLVLLAVATKSAQIPFGYWLPGAMVAPTPVSTYLHAATMVKAGIYLLFRTTAIFSEVGFWTPTLVLLGGATAVYAAATALKQDDLKALLAYSTVSQLGFLTLIIGIATPLAMAAAALHTLAHALFKGTLFMTAGIVEHETGTRSLARLGGLRRALPLTAFAATLAALSMAGLVPFLGFVSKEEVFAGLLEFEGTVWIGPAAVTLALVTSIGTFAYSARYLLGTFYGPARTNAHRAPRGFVAPAALTAVLGVALGLVVPWLDPLVNGVGRDTTGTDPELHLALWHGLTVPLAMSAVVVLVGLLLVAGRGAVERHQRRTVLPAGDMLFDRSHSGTIRLGELMGLPARSNAPATFLWPAIVTTVLAVVAVVAWVDLGVLGPPAPSEPPDFVIIVLLAGSIFGLIVARSRLAAIAALGLAGFTVAAWFVLLGAPDLALTQLLIETLTVALVVVVFRRLPPAFARVTRVRRTAAAAIAVIVGVVATAGTYLILGRRDISPVGERLLAEGQGLTGGGNVVNTILVDFRALDTLGEVTVLAVAAAGIVALVRYVDRGALPYPTRRPTWTPVRTQSAAIEPVIEPEPESGQWQGEGMIDSVVLRTAMSALAPIMLVASLWLLMRGHDAVGGGFIAGLAAGAAVVLLYFARGHGRIWQSRLLVTLPLVGTGVAIGALYGLVMLVARGAFLAGAKLDLVFGIEVAASLAFDLGVYLVVVGLVVALLRHLGQGIAEEPPVPEREGVELLPAGEEAP